MIHLQEEKRKKKKGEEEKQKMVLYSREGRRERCIKRDLSYYDKASVKKDPHTLITVFTKAL